MSTPVGKSAVYLVWLVLGCLALVMIGYGSVVSPEPLVQLVLIVAWLGLVALACLAAGGPVLAWTSGAERASIEGLFLAVTMGAGVLALIAFFLGTVGWLYAPVLGGVVFLLATLGAVSAWRQGVDAHTRDAVAPRTVVVFLFVVALVTLLAVPTPSAFYDQLHYHLAFPFQWLRLHRMVAFMRQDYSFLPANMGMLYLYALAAHFPGAAQALHWGMGALTVAGTACLARALRGGDSGWWSSVIFATTPAVLLTATWAASDLGTAAFSAAAWVMVVQARVDGPAVVSPRYWLGCGALAGLAVGCKVLALATVVAPLGVALLIGWRRESGRGEWRDNRAARAMWFSLGVVVAFLPWMLRNLALVGNPIYPLLSAAGVGGSRAIEEASVGGFSPTVPAITAWLASKAGALLLGTFSPRGTAGDIGLVYLALFPAGVFWLVRRRDAIGRLLLVGIAGSVAAWSLVPQLGRYLLPALVLLAAVEGAVWDEMLHAWSRPVRRWLTVLLAVALAWGMLGSMSQTVMDRVACTLGAINREDWMTRSVDYWSAARFVNEKLPPNATLLLVGEARCMYLDRNVVVEDPYQVPLLSQLLEREASAAAVARRLRQQGITYLLVNWSEAARIAKMTGRKDYFALSAPVAQRRLQAFFREQVQPIFSDGAVQVFALAADAP